MERKETILLHVWNNRNQKLIMSEIKDKSFNQCKQWYEYHEMIMGRSAVVHVFFDDYDIRREDCVTMATRFMKGDYTLIEVDLYSLEIKETRGVSRIHPR